MEEQKQNEKEAGRERIIHWGTRKLDKDIIFYDEQKLETDTMCITNVEMNKREVVLKQLHEKETYKKHPGNGKTVREMLEEIQK